MLSTRLIRYFVTNLGLWVVRVHSQGSTDSCLETITARTGDTCASLADFAGISVSQFLRSNPGVTSCEVLVPGAVYCKRGTASVLSTPSSSATAAATSPQPQPLRVSGDGTCGGEVTCTGSRFGRCCSAYGFCGTTSDHCGEGCRVGLGQCGDLVVFPSSSSGVSVVTVVATSTVRVTDTITTTLMTVTTNQPNPPTTTTAKTTPTPTGKPSLTLPRTPNNCKSTPAPLR